MLTIVKNRLLFIHLSVVLACTPATRPTDQPYVDFYTTDLFQQAQLAVVYPDSKTLVDCLPKESMRVVIQKYNRDRLQTNFDVANFVQRNFDVSVSGGSGFISDTSVSMTEHINNLWPVLTRTPDEYNSNSSLIPLPHPYIVPGGRFSEVYYWDSYFTMLGLMLSGKEDMAKNMVNNFSFLIDSIGFIPNGNRNYYNSRSQPPFYSLMVTLTAQADSSYISEHLPMLLKEYSFWMKGQTLVSVENPFHKRVVHLGDGEILNRYFDNREAPRPESYKEDYRMITNNYLDYSVYTDIRAAAESGWDFSSRWLKDGKNLLSIHTTDIVPVDLNSLLYNLEMTIAMANRGNRNYGLADEFIAKAEQRKAAMMKYLWNDEEGLFMDYDFIDKKLTDVKSLASSYPLFFNIATRDQGLRTSEILQREFLKPGGWVTTLNETNQQWDAPNGWAPLQWITFKGLINYGFNELAEDGARRWISLNRRVYKTTGKMVEKYNVLDTELTAGGGEYPLQDGFGWTNGVDLALIDALNH